MDLYIESLQEQYANLDLIREELKKGKSLETIEEELQAIQTFLHNHPKTREKLSNSDPLKSIDTLMQFNQQYRQIYQSSQGSHTNKKYSANKNIGQSLAAEYLYPTLEHKPTLKDFKRANRLLEKKLEQNE
jgi:anaerobic glycerol-3-phosphate dehydrogenase